MAKALIVSAGNNANEYLARHIGELGYTSRLLSALYSRFGISCCGRC